MARGEVESWFRAKDAARTDHRETFSDGEDNNRWSPRRKPGQTFSVEGAAENRGARRRSQSTTIMDQAAEALCCCGPRWGRSKYNNVNEPSPSDELRTKGRWEVNEDDEYYKPPVWKQIILKVKAQARQANCGSNTGSEWVNYDSQSYEKNFDNGSWRDSSRDLVYHDNQENEKLGLKERALHTALLHKLASSRSGDGEVQQVIISNSPALSPLPVNRSPPKPKDEFVPIWQRRASSPVTLDVRQRS